MSKFNPKKFADNLFKDGNSAIEAKMNSLAKSTYPDIDNPNIKFNVDNDNFTSDVLNQKQMSNLLFLLKTHPQK